MNRDKSPVSFRSFTKSFIGATCSLQLLTKTKAQLSTIHCRTCYKRTNVFFSDGINRDAERKLATGVLRVNLSEPHHNPICRASKRPASYKSLCLLVQLTNEFTDRPNVQKRGPASDTVQVPFRDDKFALKNTNSKYFFYTTGLDDSRCEVSSGMKHRSK
ncbi:hypothetical protein PsorP6_016077 [Peronosclerospora sorghi]|uniref:Uncharacterized protein n=1 Tax=Peronosclerospora sorghi TaxID=230839 RepID=A0ACC0WMG9_9STRA|nr:hypothetical protein PsorP6_016077 [Peronosclerospora sorghi]